MLGTVRTQALTSQENCLEIELPGMVESARRAKRKKRDEKGSNVPLLHLKDSDSFVQAETLQSNDDDLIIGPNGLFSDNIIFN